jgi:hypothetical protein
VLKIITTKEEGLIGIVPQFKPNIWGKLNNIRHEQVELSGQRWGNLKDKINELGNNA